MSSKDIETFKREVIIEVEDLYSLNPEKEGNLLKIREQQRFIFEKVQKRFPLFSPLEIGQFIERIIEQDLDFKMLAERRKQIMFDVGLVKTKQELRQEGFKKRNRGVSRREVSSEEGSDTSVELKPPK